MITYEHRMETYDDLFFGGGAAAAAAAAAAAFFGGGFRARLVRLLAVLVPRRVLLLAFGVQSPPPGAFPTTA